METQAFWNKSIAFSLGLIGAEMISRGLVSSFYEKKNSQIKFTFDEYDKWLKFSEKGTNKQVFNLISLMTDRNPWVRLKLGEFKALLLPYEKEIMEAKQEDLNA
jgi:hypothetical protein